jgi:hypothetical protein
MPNLSLEQAHSMVLGRIARAHAALEMVVQSVLANLISNDIGLTNCIIAGEKLDSLLTKITNIVHYRITDVIVLEEYNKIRSEIDRLNQERNRSLHSSYVLYPEEWKIKRGKFTRKARKLGKVFTHWDHEDAIDIKEQQRTATELLDIGFDLIKWVNKNKETMAPGLSMDYVREVAQMIQVNTEQQPKQSELRQRK